MESAIGFLMSLIFILLFIFALGVAYKNRAYICKWLNSPYYASDDRKLRLKRKIEDAQAEIEDIEAREKAETEGES